ncbi:MAG: ribosome-recycling factor [Microgenomates group bacterium]
MSYSFNSYNDKSTATLEHIKRDLSSLRTGRASTQLLDSVVVEAYGTKMKLIEVATVQAPDSTLLTVSPYDKSLLPNIERAISDSDLQLNAIVDGSIIRIPIAMLTEDKRKEMVKSLHKKIEQGKALVRVLRTQTKKEIEDQEGQDGVSEDDVRSDLEQLEEKVQNLLTTLDDLADKKEKELLTV